MAANLQQLAESLARRLGRSVAIDNARVQLLAYSPHEGNVDPVRTESILKRAVPRDVVEHVYACGGSDSTGLFTVTARADLGLDDPRIGHPIVHQGNRLGFLWLLSSDGPVLEEQHDTIRRAAEEAAFLLHREYLQAGLNRDRERELIGRLLSDRADKRQNAANDIVVEGLFTADSVAALFVEVCREGGQTTDDDQLALASGLEAVRSRRQSRHVITLEKRDQAVVIVAQQALPTARDDLIALGRDLRKGVQAEASDLDCWVGVGRVRQHLADARDSLDEARRAAHVGRRVEQFGPVADIDALGVYELLGQVPEEALQSLLHPGLKELLAQQSGTDSLVQTLEVFLDNAGDVKSASEQLFVHRTSLYYRLRRIQELTGLDLSNGDDRLVAHLGLKIARLTGQ